MVYSLRLWRARSLWYHISLCLISCMRYHWSFQPKLLKFALYGRTMGTEINPEAMQEVGIMRLFHWLEFNWEAAVGPREAGKAIEVTQAAPCTLDQRAPFIPLLFYTERSPPCVPRPLLYPRPSSFFLSLTVLYWQCMDTMKLGPSLFLAVSQAERRGCWMINESHGAITPFQFTTLFTSVCSQTLKTHTQPDKQSRLLFHTSPHASSVFYFC